MKRFLCLLFCALLLSLSAAAEDTAASPMLSAEGAHILALDANGNVWAWGSNHRGESAPESNDVRILSPVKVFENAVMVSCGQQFSMALSKDGALYMWGDNSEKQIFSCEEDQISSPVRVMDGVVSMDACDTYAACVTQTGDVLFWGGGNEPETVLTNAVQCAVGMNYAIALSKDGCVYEIYPGETQPVLIMEDAVLIDASGESRYALTSAGELYAWGASSTDGRLGLPGGMRYVDVPEKADIPDADSIHAGLSVSGCRTSTNELYVWGTLYSYVTHISENGATDAALLEGALLSYGNAPIRLYENVISAAFGDAFIALLFENGDVYTWGSNEHGQLGNGAYTQTALYEEEDGLELSILSSAQGVFPSIPLQLSMH